MFLLVSGASQTIIRYSYSPHLGILMSPRARNSLSWIDSTGRPWAIDNDCFGAAWDRQTFINLVKRAIPFLRNLLFVVVPDVLGNAELTCQRFRAWIPALHYIHRDLPLAYVAQDGQERFTPPWDYFSTLFIGGTTAWKLSDFAAELILEAKTRDKHVHVGRVNSIKRLRTFLPLGVDSIDGSGFSRFPDKYIPWFLPHLAANTFAHQDMELSPSPGG